MALEVFIVRRGVAPPAYVGHVVEVPAPPRAEDLAEAQLDPSDPAFDDRVLGPALAGLGRPERLVPYGLVEPTRWERRFVAHAAARLGVAPEAGWDLHPLQTGGPFDDLALAISDPLAPRPPARPAIALLEADDQEIEAVAAARAVRAWLDQARTERWPELLSEVLVLLPPSPGRRDTWKRVLEAHGLAADAPVWQPLAALPVGRWLVALARLSGWAEAPVHRDDLRDALLAPLFTMPEGARRSDLRACLRSLRAHRVGLEPWRAHVRAWALAAEAGLDDDLSRAERQAAVAELQARAGGLLALTDLVVGHVGRRRAALAGVLQLAEALDARGRLQASGVELALRSHERAVRILRGLADGDEDGARSPAAALQAAFEQVALRVEGRPRVGARLLSYAQYDGRPARVVVLAGLEEGGYPAAPPRLDPSQAALARALGLEGEDEQLARAARVAACAAARAGERVILSCSRVDEAGSDTFPGALLAAVSRRKPQPGEIVAVHATEASVRPAALSEVASPADLLVVSDPAVAPAVAGTALEEPWRRAAAAARHLAAVEAERNPSAPSEAGPYTGLVGQAVGAQAYSASALEKLGQCAFRYFVERILGAEETSEAGVDLDALETGSLLHLAFARAAQGAIARDGAWVLQAGAEERSAHVARVHAGVCAAVDGAAQEVLRAHPTLSGPLVNHFLERWKRALRAWLEQEAAAPTGGRFGPGGPPEPEALDEDMLAAIAAMTQSAAQAVQAFSKVQRGIDLVEGARNRAVSKAEAAEQWTEAKLLKVVPKAEFVEAASERDRERRHALLDALLDELDEQAEARAQGLRPLIAHAHGVDREAVPRRVVASEWSFGDEPDPSFDPKSTPEKLRIELPGGGAIAIRGRVDRVDLAADRPDAAVVDYKTGRAKSKLELLREIGEGRHLQLPLYARAVDALLAGQDGIPGEARAVLGRLDFVRFRKPAGALLEDGAAPTLVPAGPDGAPLAGAAGKTVQEVVAEHLAHAVRTLDAGVLPPVPRSCPLRGGTPCAAQAVCGVLEASLEHLASPVPQPRFVPPPRPPAEKTPPKTQEVAYAPAAPVADPPSFAAAGPAHEAGLARACDVGRDVIVSAGAGSGKTTALVSRYLAALRGGCRPSEILCITFTRKATAEMRSRVRERIVELDRAEVAPEALARWIAELGTAPIQTIDAFAAEIAAALGEGRLEASDASRGFAEEFVAERLAAEAAHPGAALQQLLTALPLAKVKAALARLLEQPALEEPALAQLDAAGILALWEEEAGRAAGDLAERTAELAARVARAVAAEAQPTEGFLKLREGLAAAVQAFAQHGVLGGTWAVARAWGGRAGKDAAELAAEYLELRARAGDLWAEGAAVARCQTAAEVREQVEAEAQLTAAALGAARRWLADHRQAKAERGLLSFDDVLAQAERLVRAASPEAVRSAFPYRHLLVDEFQDTSSAQYRFIAAVRERLAAAEGAPEPRLFTVGDPKQSIYRFRGAEVDLFERHVAEADPASRVALSVCWRSAPELTRAVTRLFGRIFDPALDPEALVPWEPLAPRGDGDQGPRVELLLADPAPEGGADDAADPQEPDQGADEPLERPLVRRLRELLREARPRPGESPVALLTHSWARALHYGALLQQHGLPCFVQGGRGLLETREVVDLLHWLRALERQDDDLCFVGVLRGGTVGVSDPGLYCLRQGHGLGLRRIGAAGFAPPAGRVGLSRLRGGFTFDAEAALAALAPAGAGAEAVRQAVQADGPRLAVFAAAWERAARHFGVVPLGAVLRGIVADTGYEAVLHARPGGLQALANLRSFLELADAVSEGRSPMAAVRELDRIREAGDDPGASGFTLQPGAAVTVTVVHQAKGREWDVVIVPDLHRVEVKDRVDLFDLQRVLRRTPERTQLAWIPSAVWESEDDLFGVVSGVGKRILSRALAGAERAESRRLLYVACTRARERLVLGARWKSAQELGAMAPHAPLDLSTARTWLEVVQVALQLRPGPGGSVVPGDGLWKEGRDFAWVRPAGEGYGAADPLPPAPPADLQALRRAARGVPAVPLEVVNPSALTSDAPPPPYATSAPARAPALPAGSPFASKDEEGTALHRALQLWSYRGPWDPALARTAVRDVIGPAHLEPRAARVDAIVRSLAAAQPALVQELAAAADRGEVFHEVNVGFLDAEGRRFEGNVDLLYRDRAGGWHLLDYKTSDVEREGALEARIAAYHPQVAAYAEALRGKLPGGAGLASYGLWFVEAGTAVTWPARGGPSPGRC